MATYAAFKHVELYNVGRTKKRVLRPPGGGSSDIFGADSQPQTPRTVKNRMASSIFGNDDGQKNVKNNGGESVRRTHKNVDSYSRLFGEPERAMTPAKNFMKSSIPIGPNAVEKNGSSASSSSSSSVSTSSSSSVLTNGHAAKNGNRIENGGGDHQNGGFTKPDNQENSISSINLISTINPNEIESEAIENELLESSPLSTIREETETNDKENLNISNAIEIPIDQSLSEIECDNDRDDVNNTQVQSEENSKEEKILSPDSSLSDGVGVEYTNGGEITSLAEKLNLNGTSSKNKNQINLNYQQNGTGSKMLNGNGGSRSSLVSPASSTTTASNTMSSSSNGKYSSKYMVRNPVTGFGVDEPIQKARRNLRRDGNPITGEGYKPAGAEINTSVPALNGANQPIIKNRVPPGGFSSGLW